MIYFSIIIPVYNKQKFIESTIKSVLNQSFIHFELIIVNDGSTDESEKKIKEFQDKRIRYFKKENEGVSSARNFGIERSISNYIVFIDADDYWYGDFLETIHQNTINFPDQKVFSTAIEIETSKNIFSPKYSIKKTGETQIVNYFKASSKQTVLCSSSSVFHKSIFEEIGNFDPSLKNGEDTDFWIRVGLKYQIVFTFTILARYVYDFNSLSKNKINLSSNLNFTKFKNEEKHNSDLNKFLDLNRFSLAIKSKIAGEKNNFNEIYASINKSKLTIKKRILLKLSPFILKKLIDLKVFLANIGLGNSVFK